MHDLWQQVGVLRSLLIYYGIPGRTQRLARFYSQFIQAGELGFDIGAHLGNRLRCWSNLGARAVGVEPQPQCVNLLRRWYGDNANIVLVEAAVGAASGRQDLFISRHNPTVSTLSRDWLHAMSKTPAFANVVWDRSITVPVTTLDELIAQYGEPAFCKIDVEGYELEVLKGLSRPLRTLSFEYLVATLDTVPPCMERLRQLGNYEYNWSPGESHRLCSSLWLTHREMLAQLGTLAPQGGSGDIYARLVGFEGYHNNYQI